MIFPVQLFSCRSTWLNTPQQITYDCIASCLILLAFSGDRNPQVLKHAQKIQNAPCIISISMPCFFLFSETYELVHKHCVRDAVDGRAKGMLVECTTGGVSSTLRTPRSLRPKSCWRSDFCISEHFCIVDTIGNSGIWTISVFQAI